MRDSRPNVQRLLKERKGLNPRLVIVEPLQPPGPNFDSPDARFICSESHLYGLFQGPSSSQIECSGTKEITLPGKTSPPPCDESL